MKSQIFHTPTPSDLSSLLRDIAEKQGWKNPLRDQLHEIADYVWSYNRAVNAHQELLDFVKELRRWFKEGNAPKPESLVAKDDITWFEETERLIAKAEGK